MKTIEKKIWKARQGAPFSGDEAQILGEHIENNKLNTPQKMLDDAKNENSPLHHFVEWDDVKAAEKHRVQQMRNIANHLEVEIVYVGGETLTFDRGFEFVVQENERTFIPIEEALTDKETRRQIIERALNTMDGWVRRYRQYKELKPIVDAYDQVSSILVARPS